MRLRGIANSARGSLARCLKIWRRRHGPYAQDRHRRRESDPRRDPGGRAARGRHAPRGAHRRDLAPARAHLRDRSRRHPDRPREPEPRRAGADVPGEPRGAAADRHVRRPERLAPRSRPPSMPASPPISSTACTRSASRPSSICASRASTPSPDCRTSSTARETALEERKVIDRAKGILMKAKEPHRGRGLRAAAPDRDEREEEDRRDRAVGRHRRGAVEMSNGSALRIGFIPLVRRDGADRRGRQGLRRGRRPRRRARARSVVVERARQAQSRPVRCRASAGAGRDRLEPRPRPRARCRSSRRSTSA